MEFADELMTGVGDGVWTKSAKSVISVLHHAGSVTTDHYQHLPRAQVMGRVENPQKGL